MNFETYGLHRFSTCSRRKKSHYYSKRWCLSRIAKEYWEANRSEGSAKEHHTWLKEGNDWQSYEADLRRNEQGDVLKNYGHQDKEDQRKVW